MYGFDYAYEPATEGAGFFSAVRELIRNTREKIKDFMEKVKTKLRRLTNNKDQMAEDSARAVEIVNEASTKISALLTTCSGLIDQLYKAYEDLSDNSGKTKVHSQGDKINPNDANDTSTYANDVYRVDYSRYGGMDKFKAGGADDAAKDANKAAWQRTKVDLGKKFSDQAKVAEEVSKDLKELTSMGKLSYDATKRGYDGLRAIFKANDNVDASWKKVQVAADWSTGGIKESLNKVISLYKVGVKATNAFGNRLITGNYRDENGDRLEKEDRKANIRADKNRVKIHREDEDQFNITSKRKDLKDAVKNEADNKYRRAANYTAPSTDSVGYILDRLYQVAYEDAMSEFDKRDDYLAAYESVPGAFEFVDDDDFDLFD